MLTNDKYSNIIRSNKEIFTIKEYMLYKEKYEKNNIEVEELQEEQAKYQYTNNTHDKIFRKTLENKKDAIRIINNFTDFENKIEEKEIEKYNSSYVSDELKNSEADIVYKVKNNDIFFLLEHQSKIDYSMAYRILKYEVSIIESVLAETKGKYKNKGYRYPIIIPIVLYTGEQKWNAKLDFRNMQIKWKRLEGIELARYRILDINNLDNNELLKEENIISKLIILEKCKTKEEILENIEKIINELNIKHYTEDEIKICKRAVKVMLERGLKGINVQEILKKFNKRGDDNMLNCIKVLQRDMKQSLKNAREEGKIDMIKNMLKENATISFIATVSGMKEKEIEKIAKEIKVI